MQPRDHSTSERTSGIRSVFSLAWVYRFAQQTIGAEHFRDVVATEIVRPVDGDRIIDIGCGTADILDHLPDVDYVGFDHNPRYIQSAIARHPDRGTFRTNTAGTFALPTQDRTIAMAIGVLHHLDDDTAVEVFRLAASCLSPGGRFVAIDPTIVVGQHPIARFIASQDRGQHVRSPEQTAHLLESHFHTASVSVRHDLLRVPYSHVVVEATVNGSDA